MKKTGIKFNYVFLLLGLLALVLVFFTITKGETLWKGDTWASMTMQFPEYGVMTLGVMLCFIAGCIDVSFVALADLSTVIGCMFMVKMTENGANAGNVGGIILVGVLIALVIGAIGGFLNGTLISRLGIPPILATLATQMVFRGVAIGLTQGNPVTGIPELYSEIGHMNLFGFLPVPLFVFILVFLICAFLLRYTTYGRKLYMLGSNPKAARFSAINNTRMINTTFEIGRAHV
jgi:simple sugar transport system permease protein